MVNILDENNQIIYTIDNGAIFKEDTKLFEFVDGKYVNSNNIDGGYYTFDTGVIKSWGITVEFNFIAPDLNKSWCFAVIYNFVENNTELKDAMGSTIATFEGEEITETGVIKSWGITVSFNCVIKIENPVNEQSELLLVLLALGAISIPY